MSREISRIEPMLDEFKREMILSYADYITKYGKFFYMLVLLISKKKHIITLQTHAQ